MFASCQVLHNPVTLDLLALPKAGSGEADGAAAGAGAGAAAEIQHFALPCAECVSHPSAVSGSSVQ
jgi:hypothetical protein